MASRVGEENAKAGWLQAARELREVAKFFEDHARMPARWRRLKPS
jgi:hypothetical protein